MSRVCAEPGCPVITDGRRCPTHTRTTDQARGTRQARGYGRAHDIERARWASAVRRGGVYCSRCHEPIAPDEPWHLDHSDDRSRYLGPSHARCNLAAGGRAAHRDSPRS